MSASIEQKKVRRLQLMRVLYEATDGNRLISLPFDALIIGLPWSREEAEATADYLSGEGLLEWGMGNQVSITHRGVVEVEEALSHPSRPTEHFAPLNIVFVGGSVVGSQVQTGTSGSSQTQDFAISQREAIDRFVTKFRSVLDREDFPDEVRSEAEAYVGTVGSQLELREPNEAILRESLRSLRAIAENLAASGLFIGLVELGRQVFF